MAYRVYVTDCLFYQGQNQRLNIRYIDLLNKKVDNRDGDEIALDVINNVGLRFKKE